MTIEAAVVFLSEPGVPAHLASQQARRKRHPDDHTHVSAHRLPKEQVGRTLPEDVVDDLDTGEVRVLDSLEALFDLLNAHTVVGD